MASPAVIPEVLSVRLRFDRFELDEADARLTCAGEPVALAPKPFAVLCALARTPHMLMTKNALLDAVWGHRFVTDSVLKTAISDVRAVLKDDPKQPRYIETVSRRGYRFIAAALSAPSPGAGGVETAAQVGARESAQTMLTGLCRSDGALAALIIAVAAALERERPSSRIAARRVPVMKPAQQRQNNARRQHIEGRTDARAPRASLRGEYGLRRSLRRQAQVVEAASLLIPVKQPSNRQ